MGPPHPGPCRPQAPGSPLKPTLNTWIQIRLNPNMGSTTGNRVMTDTLDTTDKSQPKITVRYPARQAAWRNVETVTTPAERSRAHHGTCGALYSSAETPEVSDCDNSSAMTGDLGPKKPYEPEDRLPTYVALHFEVAEPVDLVPNSGNVWPSKLHWRRPSWWNIVGQS